MLPEILIADKIGIPRDWSNLQDAACYFPRGKVVWGSDKIVKVFTGGHDKNGVTSRIEVPSILWVTGPIFGKEFADRESIYTERKVLYGRDLFMCAYCGNQFPEHKLTIDHVLPKSQNGKNTWVNTVTACGPCNKRKANRNPEKARMHLLYVPYVPNRFEKILLAGKNVLADQMDFLMTRIPKTSRQWQN